MKYWNNFVVDCFDFMKYYINFYIYVKLTIIEINFVVMVNYIKCYY